MRRLRPLLERRQTEVRIGPLAVGWYPPSDRDDSRAVYVRVHTVVAECGWVPDLKSRWLR